MADNDRIDDLARRIRRAISDPGAVVPRDGGPGRTLADNPRLYESLPNWQMRAVMAVIGPLVAAKDAPAGEDGAALIAAERQRQIVEEGWTPEHDAEHRNGELVRAAAVYALDCWPGCGWSTGHFWPLGWQFKATGDSDPVRTLAKAGALIAAEIDRLLGTEEGSNG